MQELGASATAFRTVVRLDLPPRDAVTALRRRSLPPGGEAVDDDIAGLGGAAKSHLELPAVLIDDAEGRVFFLAAQVMVGRLMVATGLTAAGVVADVDGGLAVDAHA